MKKNLYLSLVLAFLFSFALIGDINAIDFDSETSTFCSLDQNNNSIKIRSICNVEENKSFRISNGEEIVSTINETEYIWKDKESYNDAVNILSNNNLTMSGGLRYDEIFDRSYSVKVYSTIRVLRSKYKDVEYAKLYSAYGGYAIIDKTVSVTGQDIILKNVGFDKHGSPVDQKVRYNNSARFWTYYANKNWEQLNLNADWTQLGTSHTVYLKRNNSKWSQNLVNFFR